MKRSAIVVFVKTPGFSPIKTRLAASIGQFEAEFFYKLAVATLAETLNKLKKTRPNLEVFWAVAEQQALGQELWQGFPCIVQGEGSLGQRLEHVYQEMIDSFDSVILIGADSPHLDPQVLEFSLTVLDNAEQLTKGNFVVGPARDGGFYLFGSSLKLSTKFWQQIRYETETAGSDLVQACLGLGQLEILEPELDVDTKEDLELLAQILARRCKNSLGQKALLDWLGSRSYLTF